MDNEVQKFVPLFQNGLVGAGGVFHISCYDRGATKRGTDVECKPSLVCILDGLAYSAVTPSSVNKGNDTPSFSFGVAFR
jgi:hypothetical protein